MEEPIVAQDSRGIELGMPDVRRMNRSDLTAVARLHGAAFPSSLLSRLGPELVASYYEWQLSCGASNPSFRALVAERGGEICGFVVGGRYQGATSGFVRRYWKVLALALLGNLHVLLSPDVRRKLSSVTMSLTKLAFRRWAIKPEMSEAGVLGKSFGILALAVAPSSEGSGVGRALMSEMTSAARELRFRRMNLTVNPTNARAVSFYERAGWRRHPAQPWRGAMTLLLDTEDA